MTLQDPHTPKAKLNHKIRNIFSTALANHYRKNPELLADPEKFAKVKADTGQLLVLMQAILNAVNEYSIEEPADPAHPCDPPAFV